MHLASNQELYIHYIHKSLLAVILLCCVAITIVLEDLWLEGWTLFSLSLLVSNFQFFSVSCNLLFLTSNSVLKV